MESSVIHADLRIPDAYMARARHALETMALQWGLPLRVISDRSRADLIYGPGDPGTGRENGSPAPAVHVHFDPRAYDAAAIHARVDVEGHPAWAPAGTPAPEVDLIGGTHRLLAMLDESQIDERSRDRRGTFGCESLPAGRRGTTGIPFVEHHAAILLERLMHDRPALAARREPRWPSGKQWAAVLTHDTDAVRIGAPAEIVTNFAKAVLRRDPVSLEMVRLGLRHRGQVTGNPLFGFPVWREWERARGARSAFYLFVAPPGKRRDLNDCKSSVMDPGVDWGPLRAMADEGWEFGLHAPIHAKDDLDVFLWCKHMLEERLGRTVWGQRHHYWALDWRAPWRTYRKHVNAGFRYDTSIAWRDLPGFRAGTSLPFRPFDPERGRPLDLDVLPSSMMDGHVIGNPMAGPTLEAARALIETSRAAGGTVVFDWHTETASNRLRHPGYVDRLDEIYALARQDSGCWQATPWELVQHWHQRGRKLAVAADTPIEVSASGAASKPLKVAVLGMPDNPATPSLLRELSANGVDVSLVVYWSPGPRDQWRRVMRKLRSSGVGGVLGRARHALSRRAPSRPSGAGPAPRVQFVPHHNSEECRRILLDEQVDVVISATDAILKRRIFSAARVATLNGHPGWLPGFRGLGSAWVQMDRGLLPAMSIHRVDEGIDTGPAYAREWLDVDRIDPDQIDDELMKLRGRLFARVIRALERGDARPLDLHLEPSNMTRGMPLPRRRRLEARLRRGDVRLARLEDGDAT
jgi:methionyl-tRNA formyltransferase